MIDTTSFIVKLEIIFCLQIFCLCIVHIIFGDLLTLVLTDYARSSLD